MCDLGLRVGRRMGVNRISFWGRVMELLVCCGALCCVLLLFTVNLYLSLFPLMYEWGEVMANEYENGMKEVGIDC